MAPGRTSVPAVPLPVAHPVIPPSQFTRLGPAAEVPDEVIQPVHDLAQEVVPLWRDELSIFYKTPSAGRPLLWQRPGPCRRRRALPPLSRRPPSALRRRPLPPPQSTSPPHLIRFCLSLRPCHPPLGEVTHRYVCRFSFHFAR